MSYYRSDFRGVGQMLRSESMEAGMYRLGLVVADGARDAVRNRTGSYARSLRVTTTRRGGPSRDRAMVSIDSTDPGALSIEFGTTVKGQRAAQRPLRSGLARLRAL